MMQYPVPRVPEFLQGVRSQPRLSDLHAEAIAQCIPNGLYLEFGVCFGTTLKMLREIIPPSEIIYGFDSFLGLPEAWRECEKGSLRAPVFPSSPNIVIVPGWFADTVPAFAAEHDGEHISYMHCDADLYSSTITVLTGLDKLIVAGTVIVFDQLFGYVGWEDHEYRALTECGRGFDYIIRDEHWRAAVVVK